MANRKNKRRRKRRQDGLVLRLLILVVLVLVVFEGRLIHTMFRPGDVVDSNTADTASGNTQELSDADVQSDNAIVSDLDHTSTVSEDGAPFANSEATGGSLDLPLAGLSISSKSEANPSVAAGGSQGAVNPEYIDSSVVVPLQTTPVDDSYFHDAVLIGDSRMEGFRNTSGITQGTFLTSVGMTLTSISDTKIQTADGNITVYQGLSGTQYSKIYLMLGTNDLGFYPMEEFLKTAESVLDQFHQLQPNAVIYVCSVIYVEESKVTTDYVNNQNVISVNAELLKCCEDLPYCYYLNLNEILSDGNHSLIEGASQDGVHLYADYSKLMLGYMKSHYIT